MKALVTGATGFVGSHVVRTLIAEGHTARALHRPSSKLDALRDTHEFREIEARGVMYLKNYAIAYAMLGDSLQRQMQVWAKSIPKR